MIGSAFDYMRARDLWEQKRSAERLGFVRLEGNTVLQKSGDNFVIKFHDCPIIVIHPYWPDTSGGPAWTLSGCGYKTATTKQRIGYYAPIELYQKLGKWVAVGMYPSGSGRDSVEYYFKDKMVVNEFGMRIDDSADFIESKRVRKNHQPAATIIQLIRKALQGLAS